MADESLARSVLDKLAGIDKQLNELYNTVDAGKQLKQKLEELNKKYGDALVRIESEKTALSQQITELCRQKIELSNTVQSIIKSHAEAQERVNHALSLLQTQQTDLTELEQKLNQAFAGLDGDIASNLAAYENKLSEGFLDLQAKNDAVLEGQIKKSNNLLTDIQNHLI